jgi:hypothetical protein
MKSKMMKRYEDGGILEAANQSEDSQDIARSMGMGERNTDEPESKSRSMSVSESSTSEKPEYKSFKEAFAAERKAGNKSFEYMGKKYTTDMAARKEAAKPAEPAPKPALRAETNDDRAKRYVAKRAAARAEAAANPARGRSGVMMANGGAAYANGGVVKRAVVKSHGKAC